MHKRASPTALLTDPMSELSYQLFSAYSRSKLAQVALTCELQRRERAASSAVVFVSLHPANATTEVTRSFPKLVQMAYAAVQPLWRFLTPSTTDGAATTVFAVASPDLEPLRGAYLERCHPVPCAPSALDPAFGRRLWEWSERLLAPWTKALRE